MILSETAFEELLPPYLHDITKNRIRNALSQFSGAKEIDYSDFYSAENTDFLMQGDILHSVKGIMWDEGSGEVQSGYNPAMLISNSCDVSIENIRSVNQKDALFAPIVPLEEYISDRKAAGFKEDQIQGFLNRLRKQEFTNLFYLPSNPINKKEYLARFDRIYWLPLILLQDAINEIEKARFISLSQWGWYLFMVKLSLHNSRVPETVERPQIFK